MTEFVKGVLICSHTLVIHMLTFLLTPRLPFSARSKPRIFYHDIYPGCMLCFRVALQVFINYFNARNTGTSLYVLMDKASQNMDNIRMHEKSSKYLKSLTSHQYQAVPHGAHNTLDKDNAGGAGWF